jgi:ferric-dicitrate binding protein FerR (iron transport regulator)
MDYAAGHRAIRLDGEALFTVSHRSSAPFTVRAGSSTTRVLGTKFVVRHYATDTAAMVAVREGKVTVRGMVVSANQQVEVAQHSQTPVHAANPGRFTFAAGVLTLPVMPLSDAIRELDRWYDADIRIGTEQLAARKIQGQFAGGSLADLANILELAFDIRVVRKGHTLTLYARG